MLYGCKYLMGNGQRLSSGAGMLQLLPCNASVPAFQRPCATLPAVAPRENRVLHRDFPGYTGLMQPLGEFGFLTQPISPAGIVSPEPQQDRDLVHRDPNACGFDCLFFSVFCNEFSAHSPRLRIPHPCHSLAVYRLDPFLLPRPFPPRQIPTVNFPSQLFLRPHVPRIQSLPNLDNPITVFFCCELSRRDALSRHAKRNEHDTRANQERGSVRQHCSLENCGIHGHSGQHWAMAGSVPIYAGMLGVDVGKWRDVERGAGRVFRGP